MGHERRIPSLERDEVLGRVIPELDARGVYSRGRFGGWKYEVSNQDHSFMQGVEWVDRVVSGAQETTYRVDRHEDPNMTALRSSTSKSIAPRETIIIERDSTPSQGELGMNVPNTTQHRSTPSAD